MPAKTGPSRWRHSTRRVAADVHVMATTLVTFFAVGVASRSGVVRWVDHSRLPTAESRPRADNLTSQTALEDDDQVATGGPVVGTQCRGTPAASGEAPTRARWRMTRQIVGGGSTRGPAAPGGPRVSAVRRVPVPLTRYSGSTRWPDRVFCGLRFADPGNRCDARGIGRLFCEPVNQAGVQGARCGRRLWFGPRFRALRGFLVTWSGKCSGI